MAGRLHLFQRTPNWVLPKIDDPYSEEELAHQREHPEIQAAFRAEIYQHMDAGMTFADPGPLAEREAAALDAIAVVEDPAVRAALVPDHPFGCRRPLFSNDYYPTFNRPNVELVTDPIDRIVPEGVVTDRRDTPGGRHHHPGHRVLDHPVRVVDRGHGAGTAGASTRSGSTGPGPTSGSPRRDFPTCSCSTDPNTNNGSILTMLEAQSAHIVAQVASPA